MYPYLLIEFADGPDAHINPDAYRWIYGRGHDVVHLGREWEDLTSATIDGKTWPGLTNNPEVVRLVKEWLQTINA